MKFKTHNDIDLGIIGTNSCGQLCMSYNRLKRIFGKPTVFDEDNSDAEWVIKFEDNTIATIYNYKDGKNYLGKSGLPKTEITDWHIGGTSQRAVDLVKKAYYKVEDE